jgi:cytochrome c-type biogenesis protein CcmH
MRRFLAGMALLAVVVSTPAHALKPDEVLPDPAQEQRARAIGRELRCLVCQNQSIDDSEANLARDLRLVVRERIRAGDDDASVLRYMQARYGDFVLLRPPVKPATYLLWFGPLLLAAAGIAGLLVYFRRRAVTEPAEAAPLAEEERRRLEELLKGGG